MAWLVTELRTIVTKILRGWVSAVGKLVVRGRAMMEEKDAEGWRVEDFKERIRRLKHWIPKIACLHNDLL